MRGRSWPEWGYCRIADSTTAFNAYSYVTVAFSLLSTILAEMRSLSFPRRRVSKHLSSVEQNSALLVFRPALVKFPAKWYRCLLQRR